MEKYNSHLHIAKHLHLSRYLNDKYTDLVIADTFRLISISLVALFVPIFLLQTGYTILQVAYLELFIYICSVIFHYYAISRITSWGVKRTLVVSYLLNIILYVVLFYSKELLSDFGRYVFLLAVAFLSFMPSVLYWTAHHIYFMKATKMNNHGTKLGLLKGIPVLASVMSPFIGSIVITQFGFRGAFFLSGVLMMVASYALFFSTNIDVKVKLDFEKMIDKKHMRKNLIFFIQGVAYCATSYLWPVFLFFLAIKLISMGILYLFSNTIYAVICYLGGKKTDMNGSKGIGRLGAVGHGLTLIFRALSSTIVALTTFQSFGGLFSGMLHVAIDSGFFRHSHKDIGNSMMNREIYMHLGRIFLVIIFILNLYFFPVLKSFVIVLIISGVLTFLLNLVIKNDTSLVEEKRGVAYWIRRLSPVKIINR